MIRRIPRRALTLLLGPALLLVVGAAPASADAAGPTNYRSEVTGIEPPTDAFEARVYGGDAFVELEVAPGHELVVPGYEDDPDAAPYLRIDPAGDVFVNRRSPATFLNAARYGSRDVDLPPDADPQAPPLWEQVASGGRYAWHDHRIHWMSPSVPSQVDQDADRPQPVNEWSMPVLVDGEPATIHGTLVWEPPRSPVLPIAVALGALLLTVLLVRRRRLSVVPLAGVAALVAVGLGAAESLAAPPGAEADPLRTILPGVALVAALAGVALRSRGERASVLLGALAGVPLLVWTALQLGVLTAPVLVGAAPGLVVRIGTALTAGIAAGVLGAGGASLVEPLEPLELQTEA